MSHNTLYILLSIYHQSKHKYLHNIYTMLGQLNVKNVDPILYKCYTNVFAGMCSYHFKHAAATSLVFVYCLAALGFALDVAVVVVAIVVDVVVVVVVVCITVIATVVGGVVVVVAAAVVFFSVAVDITDVAAVAVSCCHYLSSATQY